MRSAAILAGVPGILLRRCVTIPVYLLGWAVAFLLTPMLLPLLTIHDIARRNRFAMVRAFLMLDLYLTSEVAAIVASFVLWLGIRQQREAYLRRNFRLQCWWARIQFRGGMWLYRIRTVVEGEEQLAHGPYHLFVRHVSVIDNLLPAIYAQDRAGIQLRWVLNQSLLRDPALDIVGNRLANVFVRGGAQDSEAEIARVRELARGLGSTGGTVIYPEGTLFSPAKRERILARMREGGDPELVARAEAMTNVLPLRLGGALALIEGGPEADLVFCAHTGLERATSRVDIARGSFIGTTLRIRFSRVSAAAIPGDLAGRTKLLLDEWAKVDAFVAAGAAAPVR